MTALKTFVWLVLPAVVLFGCQSTPDQAAAPTTDTAKSAKPDGSATSKPGAGGGAGAATPLDGSKSSDDTAGKSPDKGPVALKDTIYFDFDQFDIKPEFRETVLAHAAYLSKNPTASLSIAGHCDERGTPEYNIGLGDRRANAVRQLLKLQGVTDKQISTISFGELRPVAMGHDEDSWWQNRRAVFLYR